ncbi:MAG: dTDP-4-dehydrorhamnose reductase [Synergistaceae bacterium]|nr:dTDP-4-dehydrorhamnose reductase [Synergistaceae bacterium]
MTNLNMQQPSILIFGKNGQVGFELCHLLPSLGIVTAIDIDECDLTDKDSITKVLNTNNPDILVNAAAYTAVDKAEKEKELAFKLNSEAPEIMSAWAAKHDSIMVHYSTDYVFNGTKAEPWTENDIPDPLNVYGASKLKGDVNIQNSGCDYLIFRTSWVYGVRGKNFYLTMRNLLQEKKEIRVINDQFGAPTWCGTIAEVTSKVMKQIYNPLSKIKPKDVSGIYNLTNSGQTTWFGFTQAIKEQLQKEKPGQTLANLRPVSTEEYPTAAVRPKYSSLSLAKLKSTFNIETPNWDEILPQLRIGS